VCFFFRFKKKIYSCVLFEKSLDGMGPQGGSMMNRDGGCVLGAMPWCTDDGPPPIDMVGGVGVRSSLAGSILWVSCKLMVDGEGRGREDI